MSLRTRDPLSLLRFRELNTEWYLLIVNNVTRYTVGNQGLLHFMSSCSLPVSQPMPSRSHKSKVEYHTIVFLALDDKAWWSFRREPQDSRSTFFVAFSRAKHRVVFTYCQQRGGKSGIASLYELLQSAGVPTYAVA